MERPIRPLGVRRRARCDGHGARLRRVGRWGAQLSAVRRSRLVEALHDFGGSATAEVGGDFYGLLGMSRTNEKRYFNLNFGPNDAWTFGLGARLPLPAADHRGASDNAIRNGRSER